MNLNRKQRLLLSLLSGVILSLGWPARGFPFLLLIGFCPLLLVEDSLQKDLTKRRAFTFFWNAYLAMLVWNGLTTWWVCNSTVVGGILAIVLNALFMAIVLLVFHKIKMKTNNTIGYASLIVLWLAFEYLHLNWQLSWPWLTLGFGFSNYPSCIQWYEYIGPLGGTLWILLANVVIADFLINRSPQTSRSESGTGSKGALNSVSHNSLIAQNPFRGLGLIIAVVIVPLLLSFGLKHLNTVNDEERLYKSIHINIEVVQPNIDPYNEKFTGDTKTQLNKMLHLADSAMDSTTKYLIFPETALTEDIWENNLHDNVSIPLLINYCKQHKGLTIVTGAATMRQYYRGDKISETARPNDDKGDYADYYNTALQIDTSGEIEVYHKSKLVPGVEFMPFYKYLKPLADLAFKLGGESGTLGTQKEPTVFSSAVSTTLNHRALSVAEMPINIAPVICYESIYGEYVGEYVKKGANIITIITNDGWWKDTPGYKQHVCYGRMLGIETRKYVVQCANTGTSAIIDDEGNILQSTPYWKPAVIKATVPLITYSDTFYVEHRDYIGLWACWAALIVLVFYLWKLVIGK